MNYIGVIPIKKNSTRFKDKNISDFNGKPLFANALDVLYSCHNLEKIFIPTDSEFVVSYVEKNYDLKRVILLKRNLHLTIDEEPILTVLKFTHYSIDFDYKAMVVIMANCPGHSLDFLNEAIQIFEKNKAMEFRSFNSSGTENGLMIFDKKVMMFNNNISAYVSAGVNDFATEIHFQEELEDLKTSNKK